MSNITLQLAMLTPSANLFTDTRTVVARYVDTVASSYAIKQVRKCMD